MNAVSVPPSAGTFVKVFDVLDVGFRNWKFSAFGLIFVAIGLLMFFGPRIVRALDIPFLDFESKRLVFLRYFFPGFALLWTVGAFTSTYLPYKRHHQLAQTGACRIVEGPVEDFVPMPYTGHADESFDVAGVHFRYSDFTNLAPARLDAVEGCQVAVGPGLPLLCCGSSCLLRETHAKAQGTCAHWRRAHGDDSGRLQ